jgi:HTH-type transcriptional regulator/antitoxin HigA
VIQLSLRHKSDDQFWFTFFHESGHILTSSRRQFVDAADPELTGGPDSDSEMKANKFAGDHLLAPRAYEAFVDAGDFGASAVRAIAQAQQVSPGIVVGRLQRDGWVLRSHLNDLKKWIRWTASAGR